jgi:DNA-nicking Smr family endonuclease
MNESDSSLKHTPFDNLKNLHISKPLPRPASSAKAQSVQEPAADPESDKKVFFDAMKDVQPIPENNRIRENGGTKQPGTDTNEPGKGVMDQLENLVKYGEGFIISNTPEYMEGTGHDIHPEFARRLHQGDFSIQAHIDLHGLGVAEAREAFEDFLKGSVTSGKRAVLIIHGRGLSSPGEPVLKNKVSEWLTRGHWRKWVIAYASAQSYDGGTGATYVLLRHRPLTKRSRKNSRCRTGVPPA